MNHVLKEEIQNHMRYRNINGGWYGFLWRYIEEGVGVNCVKGAKPDTCWTV